MRWIKYSTRSYQTWINQDAITAVEDRPANLSAGTDETLHVYTTDACHMLTGEERERAMAQLGMVNRNKPAEKLDDLPVQPEEFVERWNKFVAIVKERTGKSIPTVQKLSVDRRKKLVKRLQEPGWYDAFKESLRFIPVRNDQSFTWQPSFSWLINNASNVFKLSEGTYGPGRTD